MDKFPSATDKSITPVDAEQIAEGLHKYWKATLWSSFLLLAVIMEGYDAIVLSSLFGLPACKEGFGAENAEGKWNIGAQWQSAVTQGVKVGQFFGLFIAGSAADKFGFKKTTLVTFVMAAGLIFIQFFCTSIGMLVAAQILFGFPLAVFLTLTTVYAAEICPLVLRPYLTTWVNLCWTIGKILAAGVLRAFVSSHSHWAYRIPFGTQWIWPPIIFVGTLFLPESPWFLVRQDRLEDARKSLRWLYSGVDPNEIENKLAEIILTNRHEMELQAGTSYLDCFKGTNLRLTEIAMSIGQQVIAFCGGIIGWFLLPHFGRRRLMLYGLVASCITQTVVSGLGIPAPKAGIAWATGAVLFIYVFMYSMTIGPLYYIIVAEIGASRLRSKTAALARNAYQVATIASGVLTSYQINTSAWYWRGKAGFFWGGANTILFVYCYFRLPEIKDRSFLELDLLFEHNINARKFKNTNVDVLQGVTGERTVGGRVIRAEGLSKLCPRSGRTLSRELLEYLEGQ
ncbi:hypothetical protein LTS15_004899 [Exophiala xenobiotica]|nr:hypothetical protein LTS15_004899 [Exophiala xenobiotica]